MADSAVMPESRKRYGAKSRRFRRYSHAQLTLLGLYASAWSEWGGTEYAGASAYELSKRWREGVGGVGGYARSSIYEWSKKLANDGLLDATLVSRAEERRLEREALRSFGVGDEEEESPEEEGSEFADPLVGGKTTIYTITRDGAKLLKEWLESPCTVPASEDEAAVRVLVGEKSLEELGIGLATVRPELTLLLRRLEETAAKRQGGPLSKLDLDLYRSLAQARLKWLDRAERLIAKELKERARRQKQAGKGMLAERQREDEEAARRYRK